jgi:hypothetical protein
VVTDVDVQRQLRAAATAELLAEIDVAVGS